MTVIKFTDTLICDGVLRKTDDGYAVQAKVARGDNVQDYLGSEVGVTDKQVVRIFRPSDEVFHKDAVASYARKPITIGHPAELVDETSWKDLAVGEIDRDVMRDGEFVSVPLLFRDAKAISLMQTSDGPKELSMGYTANIEMKDGVSPSGEKYDAIMTDFRMNHVAVVSDARGGKELRIGDGAGKWGATPFTMSDKKEDTMSDALKTVVLGDKAVQVSATDVATIEAFKADAEKRFGDAETAHAAAIAAKDEEIGALKADKKSLEDAAITPEKMTALVADRVALETTVKAISDKIEVDGVSDADLRKAAVAAKLGDEMVADASDAEVSGMFKAIAKDADKADAFADALSQSPAPKVTDLKSAYDKRDERLRNAHKAKKEA